MLKVYYLGQVSGYYLDQVCAQEIAQLVPENHVYSWSGQRDMSYENVLIPLCS